jgi:hypothetical protein
LQIGRDQDRAPELENVARFRSEARGFTRLVTQMLRAKFAYDVPREERTTKDVTFGPICNSGLGEGGYMYICIS